MQNPIYDFIYDVENTMNSITSSSIMGFVDQVLNVRYGSYTQEKFDQLLDEFCQMAMRVTLADKSEHVYFIDQALLKAQIIRITQDREYPELLSAVYFDSEANGGEGADVTVTYHIPQIFNLVLAATLDDEIYEELSTNTSSEQLLKDKQARVRTLLASLFGEYHLGIAGRCNQGVRHELVGCLNGVYPKDPGERWYFIEDMQAAVRLQISDHMAKIVTYSTDSLIIKLKPVLELSLKEFWELSEYAVDGTNMPVFIQDIQNAFEPGLILWAKEHFVNPNSALDYFNLNATNSIAATTMEHALKVPLFRAWDRLSTYLFLSYGTWLSANGGKPAIDVVINWVTEQTADSLTKLQLNKDQIDNLITLERLLNDGPTLDLLDIFGVDLKEFGIRLSTLFSEVDSIEKFWAIPSVELNELAIYIQVVINKWFNTCGSEKLLWRLIDLKQGKNVQVDLTRALVLLKQRCVQEPATWLAMRDIDLLVGALSDPQIDDVLVWAIINNNLPIVKYLANSILNSGSKIILPTHGLLSRRGHVQAIADIVAKINPDDARNLVGEIAVMLMQQMDKTAQDRAIIEKLMTMPNRDGDNCLMTAIGSTNPELAVSIVQELQELSNEGNWLSAMLTQQNSSNQNCLMLALEKDRSAITQQIINFLLEQPETFKMVLTQQNDRGWDCLMWALHMRQLAITQQIINFLLEQPEAFRTILMQRNGIGLNCLMWALRVEQLAIAQQIINFLSELPETFRTILMQQSDNGHDCLMLALDEKCLDIAQQIINFLLEQPEAFRTILMQRNGMGLNCLMWALRKEQSAIAERIIDFLSERPRAFRIVLTQHDDHGESCLMWALRKEQSAIAERIIDFLSEQPRTFKMVLMQQNRDGLNCLMWALCTKQPMIIGRIIKFLSKQPKTFEMVLTQQTVNGFNCLMCAFQMELPIMIRQLIHSLLRCPETFKIVLTQQSVNGWNCLMHACLMRISYRELSAIVRYIISFLSEQPDIFKEMLTQPDSDGRNSLMWALCEEQPAIAEQIIAFLAEQPETLKMVLVQQDNEGCSCQSILDSNSQYSDIVNKVERILHHNHGCYYGFR